MTGGVIGGQTSVTSLIPPRSHRALAVIVPETPSHVSVLDARRCTSTSRDCPFTVSVTVVSRSKFALNENTTPVLSHLTQPVCAPAVLGTPSAAAVAHASATTTPITLPFMLSPFGWLGGSAELTLIAHVVSDC